MTSEIISKWQKDAQVENGDNAAEWRKHFSTRQLRFPRVSHDIYWKQLCSHCAALHVLSAVCSPDIFLQRPQQVWGCRYTCKDYHQNKRVFSLRVSGGRNAQCVGVNDIGCRVRSVGVWAWAGIRGKEENQSNYELWAEDSKRTSTQRRIARFPRFVFVCLMLY